MTEETVQIYPPKGLLSPTQLYLLIAGMMEFSLFGIPYVSHIVAITNDPGRFSVSAHTKVPPLALILHLLRLEQIFVDSLEMLNMRCVFAGCNWGRFIHFPGTTTPSGQG